MKKDVANFIAGTTSTLNLYDNKIKALSDKVDKIEQSINQVVGDSVKQTIQVLYDSGMFGLYENSDEVLKDYLTFNSRRRGGTS